MMDKYFKYEIKIHCDDTGETAIGYVQYLKTKHWALLRKLMVSKDTVCAMCGAKTENMQIHHISYDRIGHENKETDLIVLCSECHKKIHADEKGTDKCGNWMRKSKTRLKSKNKNRALEKGKKICKNCRSYAIQEYRGASPSKYCLYLCEPVCPEDSACEHFWFGRGNK